MKLLLLLFIFLPQLILSQVGVNTTTPQETLHVEGSFRVTQTNSVTPVKLTGLDVNGTLNDVNIGKNLQLSGNILNATGQGSAYYYVATKSLPGGSSGDRFNDLFLDLSGLNDGKTLFRLTDRTANYEITGITGGTDGRHIVIFNVSTSNLKFYDEHADSLPQNRIITLANAFMTTAGYGTAEFVYDVVLQRWVMIAFRQ